MQNFRQELLSRREIRQMRQAGLLVYNAHRIVERMVKPGVTTKEIDSEVEKYFDDWNGNTTKISWTTIE